MPGKSPFLSCNFYYCIWHFAVKLRSVGEARPASLINSIGGNSTRKVRGGLKQVEAIVGIAKGRHALAL
jgi:hypothetical protein